jgi:5'-nucleotidase
MIDKPLILVSNDDGYDSPGIMELAKSMSKLGDVIIAAPDRQMSAVSSALSVAKPLRVRKMKINDFDVYSVNGTPTDTVKIAVSELLDKKPDLIVSGINHGANTSINVLYSGTVAAAIEGVLLGIPSIAFSISSHDYSADLKYAGEYSTIIAKEIIDNPPDEGTLINVNFPTEDIKGIKATKLSSAKWNDKYSRRIDPFNREYFWFAGEYFLPENQDETSDDIALKNGFISVTPLKFDFNDYNYLEKLKKYNIFNNGSTS